MYASALTAQWAPLGKSWYDSLQTKVTKRYSWGLQRDSRIHLVEDSWHAAGQL